MQVLVADNLIKQTKEKRMPSYIVAQIYKELSIMIEQSKKGYNSFRNYLLKNNGKTMNGVEDVYKYRLNSGDRILYTWAKNLSYLREMDDNAVVIFAYSKHDSQGRIPLPKKQPMLVGEELIQVFNDFDISMDDLEAMGADDLDALLELFDSDYMVSHSFYVIDVNDYEDRDPDVLDVYLSDEQNEKIDNYLKSPSPLMIIGGAGTGKTIMATHLMNSIMLTNEQYQGGYFTQSRELLRKIEKQYEYLSNKDRARFGITFSNKVEFNNINDLFRKVMGLSEQNLVRTEEFMAFINSNQEVQLLLEKNEITPIDMWTEIRGTIKGGLNKDGYRYNSIDKQDCNIKGHSIKHITELKSLKALNWKDERHFCGINDVDTFPNKDVQNDYLIIKSYFTDLDSDIRMMQYDDYLNINEEYSNLEKEKRNVAYKVCELYQEWLGDERYDENDLACMFYKSYKGQFKYDVLIVDEIQDYTEVQIYVLKKLVKNVDRFIMAGDAHQVVNPTAFSERRMYTLIGERFKKEILQKNFRCQREIVKVVNGMNQLRNQYVAKDKGSDRDESSSREGDTPIFMDYSEANLKKLLVTLMDYPGVAILVPDSVTKERLISLVGTEVYSEYPDFIWTVADIKGMEYKYVVCINMISAFEKSWSLILNLGGRKKSKYRYYFNLFYVAITRAQKYLCFVEKNDDLAFFEKLEERTHTKYRHVSSFDSHEMWVDQLNNNFEEWLKQGKKYEENANYALAIDNYKRGRASEEVINRCQMKLFYENKQYDEALKMALLLCDMDYVELSMNNIQESRKNKELIKLANILINPEKMLTDQFFDSHQITQIISAIFSDSEETQNIIAEKIFGSLCEIFYFQGVKLKDIMGGK